MTTPTHDINDATPETTLDARENELDLDGIYAQLIDGQQRLLDLEQKKMQPEPVPMRSNRTVLGIGLGALLALALVVLGFALTPDESERAEDAPPSVAVVDLAVKPLASRTSHTPIRHARTGEVIEAPQAAETTSSSTRTASDRTTRTSTSTSSKSSSRGGSAATTSASTSEGDDDDVTFTGRGGDILDDIDGSSTSSSSSSSSAFDDGELEIHNPFERSSDIRQ